MNPETVHHSSYSSQPDVQIDCDGHWTTPLWGTPPALPDGVYADDDGGFYTFDIDKATCQECIRKHAARHPETAKGTK